MPYTTLATQSAGGTASAAGWANVVKENFAFTMHTLARKSADQIVNNSTTLVNDTHLLFAVAATEVWFFQAWLMWDSAATPDIKFHWTLPASATMRWALTSVADIAFAPSWTAGSSATALLTESSTQIMEGSSIGTILGQGFTGIATISGTAGNVQLQWAQATAAVGDTTVRTNSSIIGMRLA